MQIRFLFHLRSLRRKGSIRVKIKTKRRKSPARRKLQYPTTSLLRGKALSSRRGRIKSQWRVKWEIKSQWKVRRIRLLSNPESRSIRFLSLCRLGPFPEPFCFQCRRKDSNRPAFQWGWGLLLLTVKCEQFNFPIFIPLTNLILKLSQSNKDSNKANTLIPTKQWSKHQRLNLIRKSSPPLPEIWWSKRLLNSPFKTTKPGSPTLQDLFLHIFNSSTRINSHISRDSTTINSNIINSNKITKDRIKVHKECLPPRLPRTLSASCLSGNLQAWRMGSRPADSSVLLPPNRSPRWFNPSPSRISKGPWSRGNRDPVCSERRLRSPQMICMPKVGKSDLRFTTNLAVGSKRRGLRDRTRTPRRLFLLRSNARGVWWGFLSRLTSRFMASFSPR